MIGQIRHARRNTQETRKKQLNLRAQVFTCPNAETFLFRLNNLDIGILLSAEPVGNGSVPMGSGLFASSIRETMRPYLWFWQCPLV